DEPGEWYLNYHTGVIYYIPLEGENLINAKVEAPYLGEFIQIKGDAKKLNIVENIHFKDITFKYTNFMLSEGDQGDMQAAHTVPAAITIEGSSNCSFNGCKLIHLGTYAFEVKKGCSNISFTNNSILNTAAGGFKVNGGDETDHPWNELKIS
ncbi:MAG: right-handed parallel beta-helix repeat-containing protein, partial [Bacteroidetes bacterium]|nr:right-handed parallel beta-helix repeat-containing protein [Bacteroidota bacterium]